MEEKKEIEKRIKMLNDDLEDLESYIRDFSSFLPLAVCTVNPLGRIVNINKAAEDLIGYMSYEIMGEFLESIFLEKEEVKKIIDQIIKDKHIYGREMTLITKKKKKIPASISVSIREDKQGNFIGYFIALSDISEIKNLQHGLEKKVEERTIELQKRIGELERFNKLTIGRELRMIELKKEIKKLKHVNKKRSG